MQSATSPTLETVLTKRFQLATEMETAARTYRAKCNEFANFQDENFDALRTDPRNKFAYVDDFKSYGDEVLKRYNPFATPGTSITSLLSEQIAADNDRIRTETKGDH